MNQHVCDPVLEATGAPGPLTTSRAMRLLLTYFHDQALAGDAMPVLLEIGDCGQCMFAVVTTHLHVTATLLLNLSADERSALVAQLEQQLADALDQLEDKPGDPDVPS